MICIDLPAPEAVDVPPENLPITIVYEDDDLVAIDKPRGMSVHPGAGRKSGTVVNAVLSRCTGLSGVGGKIRPGVVHRLDRGTSGIMILAKNDLIHLAISRQFASRTISKTYLAVAAGYPEWNRISVDQPIRRHKTERKKMAVDPGGKTAQTEFECRGRCDHASFIVARPKTGRTHQIRVHLKYLGIPVLGDSIYGKSTRIIEPKLKAMLKEMEGFCLHAYRLDLLHPRSGKPLSLIAPLPQDILTVIETCGLTVPPGFHTA